MRTKNVPVSGVKAGPADGLDEGEFLVYPATFTRTPDAYGDVIAKGAFADTIQQWKDSGNTLPGLYGHRMDDPNMFVASASDMGEDDHGWWVKGNFDLDNPTAKQVYKLVKGRRLNQLSFAYDVLDEGSVELDDGGTANELRKVKTYEFSFVPVGANQDTSVVDIKGLKTGRVLAAKHVQRLKDARDALSEVIAAAEPDEPKAAGIDTKDVTPYADLPMYDDRDRSYRDEDVLPRVRKWASSDGSGDKDTIDWDKYRKAFMWWDKSNPEEFGSYDYKFADVVDGKLYAIWRGVTVLAGVVQGARGGPAISDSDIAGVKSQIEKYYAKARKKFDDDSIQVPWNKASAPDGADRQDEASVPGPANDEARAGKSEEPSRGASADRYLAVISIEELGVSA